jgi:hypothetical protein
LVIIGIGVHIIHIFLTFYVERILQCPYPNIGLFKKLFE